MVAVYWTIGTLFALLGFAAGIVGPLTTGDVQSAAGGILPLLLGLLFFALAFARRRHNAIVREENARLDEFRPAAEWHVNAGDCPTCGEHGVGWNIVHTRRVTGLLVASVRSTRPRAGCSTCIQSAALKDALYTFMLGWWSISGAIATPFVLIDNLLTALSGKRGTPTKAMLRVLSATAESQQYAIAAAA